MTGVQTCALPILFEFPASKSGKEYNFIKLVGRANQFDTWSHISEFRIFGYRYGDPESYEQQPVKLYPNPANEYFTIRIDEPLLELDFLRILDLSGKSLLQEKLDKNMREYSIPIDLRRGIYVVQMGQNELTLFTQKLVVQN